MMKKLLVLALVLGVAGLASAGLAFKVNGTDVADGGSINATGAISLEIVNDELISGSWDIGWIGVTAGATSGWLDGTVGSNMVGTWTLAVDGPDGGAMYWYTEQTVAAVGSTAIGSMYTIGFNANGAVLVEVYNADFDTVQASMTITPEPMTMLLLGLGGLFLRKKK
jgi:hypothetical protein